MHNLRSGFSKFKETELNTWKLCQWYIPHESLLVALSGLLQSPIAHHLHQPSFISSKLEYGEVSDDTNPSTAMVMSNVFKIGKTLIYDHLSRRHPKSEQKYDQITQVDITFGHAVMTIVALAAPSSQSKLKEHLSLSLDTIDRCPILFQSRRDSVYWKRG